jgi:hypothetical protein
MMHWLAVCLTAYAAMILEVWQLCDNAPLAPEDF